MTNHRRPPINSAAQAAEFPILQYAEMLGAGSSSNAIVAQEAKGGKSFITSDTLPNVYAGQKDILESYGVVFGSPVPGDDLFTYVQLPEGWKKVLSDDDPRGSYLLDNKGRRRAFIFYKAAFYDRDASITLLTRFSVRKDYGRINSDIESRFVVMDSGTIVFTSDNFSFPAEERYTMVGDEANDAAKTQATLWLEDRYPDWQNQTAYWD